MRLGRVLRRAGLRWPQARILGQAALCLHALFAMGGLALQAAPLSDVPTVVEQPWGETLMLLATGDELYRRLHDADGFTVIQDPTTGAWVYASRGPEGLAPTVFTVGLVDPRSLALEQNLIEPPALVRQRRNLRERLAPTPPHRAPSAGTFRNVVIFVRFADEEEFGDI